MNKPHIIILFGLLQLFLSIPILAANKIQPSEDRIIMYSNYHAKKVIEKVLANTALVPIYRQKGWIKMGNPKNGHVGWVNEQQMQQARRVFFRPDIQTIYMHTDHNARGKLQLNIVAYRNGRKLSSQEAQHLYQTMRRNQQHEIKRMQRIEQWMDAPFFNMNSMHSMFVLPAL